jgi:hypothetical protein
MSARSRSTHGRSFRTRPHVREEVAPELAFEPSGAISLRGQNNTLQPRLNVRYHGKEATALAIR